VRLADRLDEDGLPYALGGRAGAGCVGRGREQHRTWTVVFVSEQETRPFARQRGASRRDGGAGGSPPLGHAHGLLRAFFGRTRGRLYLSLIHPWHAEMQRRRVSLPTLTGNRGWFLSLRRHGAGQTALLSPRMCRISNDCLPCSWPASILRTCASGCHAWCRPGTPDLGSSRNLARRLATEPG